MNFTEMFGSLSSMVENFENISQIDLSAILGSQAIEIAKAEIIGAIVGFALIALTAAVVVPVAIKNIAKTPRIIILLAYFAVGIPVFISVRRAVRSGKRIRVGSPKTSARSSKTS